MGASQWVDLDVHLSTQNSVAPGSSLNEWRLLCERSCISHSHEWFPFCHLKTFVSQLYTKHLWRLKYVALPPVDPGVTPVLTNVLLFASCHCSPRLPARL